MLGTEYYTCSAEFKKKFSAEDQNKIFCLIDFGFLEESELPDLESDDLAIYQKRAMRDPSYQEYYEQA